MNTDSLNDDALVDAVAQKEHWTTDDQARFVILRDAINASERLDEAFLIVRSGPEPMLDRAIAVASWPWWTTVPLRSGDKPVLDALAALANDLRARELPPRIGA